MNRANSNTPVEQPAAAEPVAAGPGGRSRKAAPRSNGGTRRQTRKKAPVPEDVLADAEALRTRIGQADEMVRGAINQAQGLQEEINQVRQQLVETRNTLETIRQEGQAPREVRQRSDEPRPQHPAAPAPAVLAVASEDGAEPADGQVVHATVRAESSAARLTRYLNLQRSVKEDIADALASMARDVFHPGLRAVLEEQRQLTRQQKEQTEARLKALGGESSGGRGALQRLAGSLWESWAREPDDYDRTMQVLVKALTAQKGECSLAQALEALARAAGDTQTAELARRHAAEKQEAVDRLGPFVATLAEWTINAADTAVTAQLDADAAVANAGLDDIP